MRWLVTLLSAHLSADDGIILSAAVSALMAFIAIWNVLVVRDPMASRIKALSERRNTLRIASQARRNRATSDLRTSSLSFMRRMVMKLNLMRGDHIEQISLRLARAGMRSRDAVVVYLFAKAILPFALGGAGLLFFSLSMHSTLSSGMRLMVLGLGFIGGFLGADLFVKNIASKRGKEMVKALPDALDLMVICAEAGLSLDASMTRVGNEIGQTSPVLAEEFSLTAIELGFLPSRQAALNNLTNRTNIAKLRAMVNALLQTERYGTPLANALRVLAAEFRDERMLKAEEKAARLPAIMTVPMIVFILPALFIVLGGPAAIQVMAAFK